ncbi:hypothetical protein [Chryseobacterium sp. ISL-6]|uniref:hypothetical protein n=1 Tax=Chryseobacterium sp. ISL-6 TaxID=2819143 RepID=UPI001BEC5CF2|nr:hypothetical protein [Chryseobacterium sp. ISL-6]MBT2621871.1 hypothetical protein [Chryseobacterium sp. ISL-6]
MASLTLFAFLLTSWIYRLEELPGLHADEAWFGLEATIPLNQSTSKLTGMTYYTGILQVLVSKIQFSLGGISVFNLRLSGVIFNFFGVVVVWALLYTRRLAVQAVIFLLIISQSALFLTSPRVAWEVNTFTLLFSSLLLLFIIKFVEKHSTPRLLIFLILLISILGSYNHIIYSAVPLALMLSCGFYFSFTRKTIYFKLLIILAVALGNIGLQLLYFKFGQSFWSPHPLVYTILIIFVLLVQAQVIYLLKIPTSFLLAFKPNKRIIFYIYLIALIPFFIFHGKAFFEILTGYKIYMQYYSLESEQWMRLLSCALSIMLIVYLVFQLRNQISNENTQLFTLFLLSFMVVFSFYTTTNSYRYYLQLYLIISLYIAVIVPAVKNLNWTKVFISSLVISLGGSIYTQLKVFDSDRHDKAMYFNIGNNQSETSAHFLTKKPLINFLKRHQVDSLILLNIEPYFLNTPIDFYKQASPWSTDPRNKAVIMFQTTDSSKDGILYFIAK